MYVCVYIYCKGENDNNLKPKIGSMMRKNQQILMLF